MPIFLRTTETHILVFGQTFAVKEQLKSLGGRFNSTSKTWSIPHTEVAWAKIKSLCTAKNTVEGASAASVELEEIPSLKREAPPATIPSIRPEDQLWEMEAPREGKDLSLHDVVHLAEQAISETFKRQIWVVAELQNVSVRNGHIFLQLSEGKSQETAKEATISLKATIWSSQVNILRHRHGADTLKDVFQDGFKVRILCTVQFYKDRGQLSLTISDFDPKYTKGAIALAREEVLRKLRKKGLDQANKRLVLANFAMKVALLTAPGSRAESDFLDQLSQGGYRGTVYFHPIATQGPTVAATLISGLRKVLSLGVDLVVITRGGGSAADLRWFDGEDVAFAIAHAPVPVVCAIGHHDDRSVAEDIAFAREKTPTAAAEFVLQHFKKCAERIDLNHSYLVKALQKALGESWERHNLATLRLQHRVHQGIDRAQGKLKTLERNICGTALNCLHQSEINLERLKQSLKSVHQGIFHKLDVKMQLIGRELLALDPTPWMKRGWTQLVDKEGNLVLHAKEANPGDELHARLMDGVIQMRVT